MITREEMKNCVWLKPKLVAEIEFAEWTVLSVLENRPDDSARSMSCDAVCR